MKKVEEYSSCEQDIEVIMIRRIWRYFFLSLTGIMLTAGVLFEEPHGNRLWILLILSILYGAVLSPALLMTGPTWYPAISAGGLAVLLTAIEFNSQYAVNYFFHSLYILLIFFCISQVKLRWAVVLSLLVMGLSLVKFIQLILVQRTFANIALLVFFGSVQVLVAVVGIFLKVYQEETRKTKQLYGELLETHTQLKVYAEEIRELTRMEARTKIARDLHDTLGHELTGLIMQIEMAGSCFEQADAREGMALLQASKQSARDSLVKVRKIVDTLKTRDGFEEDKSSIQNMMDDFSARTGCRIRYTDRGKGNMTPARRLVVYRVIQESLTNAVRHGKATEIEVTLIYGSDSISFEISNNGECSEHFVEGNGMRGMRERRLEVGGSLQSQGSPVFKVWGTMPYEEVTE